MSENAEAKIILVFSLPKEKAQDTMKKICKFAGENDAELEERHVVPLTALLSWFDPEVVKAQMNAARSPARYS